MYSETFFSNMISHENKYIFSITEKVVSNNYLRFTNPGIYYKKLFSMIIDYIKKLLPYLNSIYLNHMNVFAS